jgi:hypothetical protein
MPKAWRDARMKTAVPNPNPIRIMSEEIEQGGGQASPSLAGSAWAVVKGGPDGLLYMAAGNDPVEMVWSKNIEDAVAFHRERDAKLIAQVFWNAGSAVTHVPIPLPNA